MLALSHVTPVVRGLFGRSYWRGQAMQEGWRGKRKCRAGVEKKGMYREKGERDVMDLVEVRPFACATEQKLRTKMPAGFWQPAIMVCTARRNCYVCAVLCWAVELYACCSSRSLWYAIQ